jgi:ferrous iron transport protein B
MSCSARLPVYTILIALVIPNEQWGPFNLQGLVMFGLYALGIVLALCIAYVMKWLVRTDKQSIFIMELPVYKWPRWKTVLYSMYERAKIFTLQAGKIILLISFVLWGLSSYGPGQEMAEVETEYDALIAAQPNDATLPIQKQHALLEHSYAGHFGKWIEPAIEPLGYDWKIGIALLMSFAAREVFVGTMATLYSVHDSEENDLTLRTKMQQAQKADGSPVYTLATGMSLLIFYAIALQCMSTLAIVRRETQSWWFAIGQFVAFGLLAYALAYVAYQALA